MSDTRLPTKIMKPCPECGSRQIRFKSSQVGEDYVESWFECMGCKAVGPGCEDNFADAATAQMLWNKRPWRRAP